MSKSEEKRLLDETLKEVDSYFSENGLLEDINAFCESEEVRTIIQKWQNNLISNMKRIEASAPESIQSVAKEMRNAFENNLDSFWQDAIANFKIRFQFSVEVMLGFAPDDETKKQLLEMTKKNIYEAGIVDMREICVEMTQRNTVTFRESVYMQYVPEGMPPEVASFIRLISGGGPMIPLTAFMVDLESGEDEQNPTES